MSMSQDFDRNAPAGRLEAAAALVAYIDFRSANCRLALGPTLALADAAGAAVDWRPFHARPKRPKKGAADASRSAVHARMRADYRRREQALYARNQGIELIHPPPEGDGFAANAGLSWLRRQGAEAGQCRAYVTQVFEEVWAGRMNPADAQATAAAIATAGGDDAAFGAYLAGPAQGELDAVVSKARALGANDTPAFVVGGELYIGRQHLPVIRWWLTGQEGEPPV